MEEGVRQAFEWKDFVDHWLDVTRVDETGDIGELRTIRFREKPVIGNARRSACREHASRQKAHDGAHEQVGADLIGKLTVRWACDGNDGSSATSRP